MDSQMTSQQVIHAVLTTNHVMIILSRIENISASKKMETGIKMDSKKKNQRNEKRIEIEGIANW